MAGPSEPPGLAAPAFSPDDGDVEYIYDENTTCNNAVDNGSRPQTANSKGVETPSVSLMTPAVAVGPPGNNSKSSAGMSNNNNLGPLAEVTNVVEETNKPKFIIQIDRLQYDTDIKHRPQSATWEDKNAPFFTNTNRKFCSRVFPVPKSEILKEDDPENVNLLVDKPKEPIQDFDDTGLLVDNFPLDKRSEWFPAPIPAFERLEYPETAVRTVHDPETDQLPRRKDYARPTPGSSENESNSGKENQRDSTLPTIRKISMKPGIPSLSRGAKRRNDSSRTGFALSLQDLEGEWDPQRNANSENISQKMVSPSAVEQFSGDETSSSYRPRSQGRGGAGRGGTQRRGQVFPQLGNSEERKEHQRQMELNTGFRMHTQKRMLPQNASLEVRADILKDKTAAKGRWKQSAGSGLRMGLAQKITKEKNAKDERKRVHIDELNAAIQDEIELETGVSGRAFENDDQQRVVSKDLSNVTEAEGLAALAFIDAADPEKKNENEKSEASESNVKYYTKLHLSHDLQWDHLRTLAHKLDEIAQMPEINERQRDFLVSGLMAGKKGSKGGSKETNLDDFADSSMSETELAALLEEEQQELKEKKKQHRALPTRANFNQPSRMFDQDESSSASTSSSSVVSSDDELKALMQEKSPVAAKHITNRVQAQKQEKLEMKKQKEETVKQRRTTFSIVKSEKAKASKEEELREAAKVERQHRKIHKAKSKQFFKEKSVSKLGGALLEKRAQKGTRWTGDKLQQVRSDRVLQSLKKHRLGQDRKQASATQMAKARRVIHLRSCWRYIEAIERQLTDPANFVKDQEGVDWFLTVMAPKLFTGCLDAKVAEASIDVRQRKAFRELVVRGMTAVQHILSVQHQLRYQRHSVSRHTVLHTAVAYMAHPLVSWIVSESCPLYLIGKYYLRLDDKSRQRLFNSPEYTALALEFKQVNDTYIDILESVDVTGNTPLHYAAFFGNLTALKALLNSGADPKKRDHKGATAMHWAVAGGHLECVRRLTGQEGGLSTIYAADLYQQTPFHILSGAKLAGIETMPEKHYQECLAILSCRDANISGIAVDVGHPNPRARPELLKELEDGFWKWCKTTRLGDGGDNPFISRMREAESREELKKKQKKQNATMKDELAAAAAGQHWGNKMLLRKQKKRADKKGDTWLGSFNPDRVKGTKKMKKTVESTVNDVVEENSLLMEPQFMWPSKEELMRAAMYTENNKNHLFDVQTVLEMSTTFLVRKEEDAIPILIARLAANREGSAQDFEQWLVNMQREHHARKGRTCEPYKVATLNKEAKKDATRRLEKFKKLDLKSLKKAEAMAQQVVEASRARELF